MKRSGSADMPLHYGHVPPWLANRMATLGLAIVETIAMEYGRSEVIRRLADPFWFQSLGCVMGMDWHSSGITTSVMGALKKSVNPRSKELGIYICGGKGRHSRETPNELLRLGNITGLDANHLVHCSKLTAKVDNTAIQDGFQLYLHSFILDNDGNWAVVQQGMSDASSTARRYHWHSQDLKSFVEEPHTFIYGRNRGQILNMTDKGATASRTAMIQMAHENPDKMLREIRHLVMPDHHDVRAKDIDVKRLGTTLWLAHETQPQQFEDLLMLQGVGPRTIQSLALVSEVIYGAPSRFQDPARFSFAHGGKDGHPFPVPTKVYDEAIAVLRTAIDRSKLGNDDKRQAVKKLSQISMEAEKDFTPDESGVEEWIEKERRDSWKYGGKTVFGDAKPPTNQLTLF